MTCEELSNLLPDLFDGTLTSPTLQEAQMALRRCLECQKELELFVRIRNLIVKLVAFDTQLQPSVNFKANLMARIEQQK